MSTNVMNLKFYKSPATRKYFQQLRQNYPVVKCIIKTKIKLKRDSLFDEKTEVLEWQSCHSPIVPLNESLVKLVL